MDQIMNRQSNNHDHMYAHMYPEIFFANDDLSESKMIGIVVTKNCNLRCSYCYEHGKNTSDKADINKIKRFIDMLFTGEYGMDQFINQDNCFSLILEFIGGEPFLETALIDESIDYFMLQAIAHKSPWALHHKFFIATNGTLIHTEAVHDLIRKNQNDLIIGVTVDGDKQSHDSCRLDANGNGTYNKAMDAVYMLRNAGIGGSGKLTISPDNVSNLFHGVKNLIDHGYEAIHMNPVFEDVWTYEHARSYFQQLKSLADFLIEHHLDELITISVFNEHLYCPDTDDKNPCGGNGQMLVMDYDGTFYPCARYTSIANDLCDRYRIGSIIDGYGMREDDYIRLQKLHEITRTSASSDTCNACSINRGCVWCNGYNYEVHHDPGIRTTFTCVMHKAASLANAYYFNSKYRRMHSNKRIPCYLPSDEACKIISKSEYEQIKELEKP